MNNSLLKQRLTALFCLLSCICFAVSCGSAAGAALPDSAQLIIVDVQNKEVEISEDILLVSDEQDITGISLSSTNGADACVNTDYSIQIERKPGSVVTDTKAVGLAVFADGEGSMATAHIGNRISAAATVEDGNADTVALDISVSNGGIVNVDAFVALTAEARQLTQNSYTWAAGISLYNTDAQAEVFVDGNVTALSDVYGVAINSHVYADKAAHSKIQIFGDVNGTTYGILAEQGSPDAEAEIFVDGTVSGQYASILVDGMNPEQALITVWKVETDSEGHSVHYFRDDEFLEPMPEAEKALQYIIRTDSGIDKFYTLEGTTEYKGYQIAHEGDTLYLTLNIPKIYTLAGVFMDAEQNEALEQDEKGRYFLKVPRGGGVELSVKLENADEYAALLSDMLQAYQSPDEQAEVRIDADAAAISGQLGTSIAEAWKSLFLDPEYKLYLYGTDDPQQLPITGKHAFVVLGYQLENGEMALELVGRCEAAAAAARAFPDSILICSGGATGSDNPEMHTEAGMMKAYLSDKCGISPDRIFIDERALTTTENARNTLAILKEQEIETMTIITSSYHQKRGQILYTAMAGRYYEEEGYSVKVIGNYCYPVEKDEDALNFETMIAVIQLADILDLPDEQSQRLRALLAPPSKK